jgi:outer membrane protein insertion porin family
MIRSASYLLLLILLALAGCTGMRYIKSTDPLFVGSEIKIKEEKAPKKKLTLIAKDVVKPAPNSKFFWMRPGLARYNMLSDSAKVKKFWKKKITAPVLLSHVKPTQVMTAMQNRLFHNGYFQNSVAYDTILVGKRKAKYVYTITLHEPYTIDTVLFPKPTNDLTQKIYEEKDYSVLIKGDVYSLDAVKNERTRIDRDLKEKGYIYFSPEFLLFKADTVTGVHQLRAELTIKPETPPESRKPYTIGKFYIHDDNALLDTKPDTSQYGPYFLISRKNNLKFDALQKGIFIRPGETYNRSDYLHTIRYMNDLPIIRNANMKFATVGQTDTLDAYLYLSQKKRNAYSAEFNTVFRSTNYFGPGIIFSYTDRNVAKGAEMLKINLRGSIEMQIVDGQINPAYELGLGMVYTLPRFYPWFLFNSKSKSLPKTNIAFNYTLFNRLDLYRLNSSTLNFGWSWSKTDYMNHKFNPIEINFTRVPEESKTQEFKDYLEENPGIQRSFDEQFIMGVGYEFTYRSPGKHNRDFFFRGAIDMAGNTLNLIYSASHAEKDSLGRYIFLGVPFSQYFRPRIDVNNTLHLNRNSSLVSRLSAGVGIPLGNSAILPYVKQFYVGGTNSLRSFIARSLGPGSEVPPEGYNDQAGDIRLEGNLEYRFTFAGSFKGALFMDAGNIWLYNNDPARPNGVFHFDTFLQQVGISYGWGLRWDFDFIVARLDFAYTLRTPYLPEGERWSEGFEFWNPVINVAIGYPF